MAKSSYLDNLINNKLTNMSNRYLTNLWDSYGNTGYTYFNNRLASFTNDEIIALTSSDYLNNLKTNQTVLDMTNPVLSSITLNTQYLPINRNNTNYDYSKRDLFNGKIAPPEYLPARITSIKGGSIITIPILFPSSFSRSISASFAKENPVGSDKPIMAYSYTDAEQIPFEFDALADYLPEPYTSLKGYVEDIISILKPGKTNNIIHEPTVEVTFADITFRGICNSINISYDNVYGYKSFVHAKISCQFTRLS